MKKLLQHLLAHLRTSDDSIMIYDSLGTFAAIIGECILIDPTNPRVGAFLGIPVMREILCRNEQLSEMEFLVRIKRKYLNLAIARIKDLISSCS